MEQAVALRPVCRPRVHVSHVAFREATRCAEAVLSPFLMVSSSVLGPAVTFRVSASVQNMTTGDVAQAAGKAVSTQHTWAHTPSPGGGGAQSPQHPDISRGDGRVGQHERLISTCDRPGCGCRKPETQSPLPRGAGPGECGAPVWTEPVPFCFEVFHVVPSEKRTVAALLSVPDHISAGRGVRIETENFIPALLLGPQLFPLTCLET